MAQRALIIPSQTEIAAAIYHQRRSMHPDRPAFDELFPSAQEPYLRAAAAVLVLLQDDPMKGWRSLKDDPPGPEHRGFFIGHSEGGRMDLVFMWPHPKTGKMAFWSKGEHGNYLLYDYGPDVWHPAPPLIPGSDVEAIQKGKLP